MSRHCARESHKPDFRDRDGPWPAVLGAPKTMRVMMVHLRDRVATVAVSLLIAWVLTSALTSLPLDEHETLVVGTAAEMLERETWITPYFNNEPRLNKPPLNYWLTMALTRLGEGGVMPWHGRAVSAFAAVLLVFATWYSARRLVSSRTAVLACLMLGSSAGMFSYAHDARPDMLYAALCYFGVLCFSFCASNKSASTAAAVTPSGGVWVIAMWVCFALATLAKGPHIPLTIALACIVWWMRQPKLARPAGASWLMGFVVFLLISIPWWLLLKASLPPTALAQSQLSGSLLRPSLALISNGYYFYRPLQLVLPWLPLVLAGWLVVALRWRQMPASTRLFAGITLLVLLVLSIGPQQRFFYVLPVLPLMVVIAANGIDYGLSHYPRAFVAALTLQFLTVSILCLWLCWTEQDAVLLLLALALAGLSWLVCGRTDGRRLRLMLAASFALSCLVLVRYADSEILWSSDRFAKQDFAASISAQLSSRDGLVSFQLTPTVYVYLLQRPIKRIDQVNTLKAMLRSAGGPVYVLTETRFVPSLIGASIKAHLIAAAPTGMDDPAGLYQLQLEAEHSALFPGDGGHSGAN